MDLRKTILKLLNYLQAKYLLDLSASVFSHVDVLLRLLSPQATSRLRYWAVKRHLAGFSKRNFNTGKMGGNRIPGKWAKKKSTYPSPLCLKRMRHVEETRQEVMFANNHSLK